MKHSKRRFAIIASTTAAVLLGGGIAAAYWTSTGTGTGTAPVDTTTNVQISTATSATALVPGGSSAISFTVTNPDAAAVVLNDVAVTVASVTQASGAIGACLPGDFSVLHTAPATPVTINAGQTITAGPTNFGSYTLVMANTSSNQDGCKGATVNLATAAS